MRNWYDTLSEEYRKYTIHDGWSGNSTFKIHPEDEILRTSQSASQFLETVANAALKHNPCFARQTLEFALTVATTATDKHFIYNRMLELDDLYVVKQNPEHIHRVLDYCRKDVDQLEQFKSEWTSQYGDFILSHPALDTLIDLLEFIDSTEEAKEYRQLREQYGLDRIPDGVIEYQHRMAILENTMLDLINQMPGILQTEIYSEVPEYRKDEIQKALRESPYIRREKHKRTYRLFSTEQN